ncbi:hypothetical protein ICM_01675 [Bacillus cereus BAG1X2-3]|uniref:Uncharacterized protein n=1 Tax=Bacillus cereus TaxID=1396 RepID=A0A9X7E9T0_BACCE|nr:MULTISPECIES: hypothetical protein [Bacillus cereus group]AKR09422.1 hypothetical protein AC241_12010 [Bacillus thuringiensis]EOO27479.1 hypothetical protein ICC_03142 [Bacillus cereus BAG1X1-1]EOO49719.1 hypothetical protein ICI_02237 [Bacillus cereus BAG1X2-1]EOO51913.1 hypothetical protein ICK_03113 [Bacillus cereus BAG1X2-2]EOO60021.1 hypothetical protein ICM_01675 [Bacillus cereus BAG1X2-3]
MNIKFSYKGVFLLLFGVICANLLFVPLLGMLNLSQMHSIWLVTSIAASVLLTVVVSFIDGSFASKAQLSFRFILFSIVCTLITYMIVF